MAELKPCPFCGGVAEISLLFGRYGVACSSCQGAIIPCPYQSKEEAIEAWNRRAEDGTENH